MGIAMLIVLCATLTGVSGLISADSAIGIMGLAVVAAAVATRDARTPLRVVAILIGLGMLAYGGWLDFATGDYTRAKPSPHYLGPPKIQRPLVPFSP